MSRSGADPARVRSYRLGRLAEHCAAVALMARGYRILARRHRTPYGEIDIIAARGRRIAFVEVKQRPTWADAVVALEGGQARRIADAAEHWIARRPRYRDHDHGFDAVLVVPWRLPHYLRDALQPNGTDVRSDR